LGSKSPDNMGGGFLPFDPPPALIRRGIRAFLCSGLWPQGYDLRRYEWQGPPYDLRRYDLRRYDLRAMTSGDMSGRDRPMTSDAMTSDAMTSGDMSGRDRPMTSDAMTSDAMTSGLWPQEIWVAGTALWPQTLWPQEIWKQTRLLSLI